MKFGTQNLMTTSSGDVSCDPLSITGVTVTGFKISL